MKVIEDKVTVYPPHAICKADVPVILASLPPEWSAGIETVRLCSSQKHPVFIASFRRAGGSLTITSRGFTKERTLRAILTELAGHALGLTFLSLRRLQKRDVSRVRRLIAPFAEEILPQLSRKKVWLDK
jgi:hypothetical protein